MNYQGGGRGRGRGGHWTDSGRGSGRGGRHNSWNGRGRAPPSDSRNGGGAGWDEAPPDTNAALRVLAVYEQGSRIAFACYNEESNEIIFEDARSSSGTDTERVVGAVLAETQPNLILVSNRVIANAPLLECLTTMPVGEEGRSTAMRRGDGNAEAKSADEQQQQHTTGESIPYQLLKSSAFEPRQCKSVILHKLRVMTLMSRAMSGHHPEDFSHSQALSGHYASTQAPSNYHSLASVIDFESPTLVRALGALLTYLRQTAFRLEEGFTVTINNIRRCPASESFLRLEAASFRTLRIFATDHHPLVANNNVKGRSYNQSKEGFSLYTLLDRTKSKAGRERLRQWMTQPLRDAAKIRQRHTAIDLFLHPECHPAVSLVLERLSDVVSMDAILMRMQRCSTQPNDFLVLIRMLDAAYAIVSTLSGDLREKAYMLDREAGFNGMADDAGGEGELNKELYPSVAYIDDLLRRCHVPVTRDLREKMIAVIDVEITSETKDHVIINWGYHDELDRAKETFETLDETLSEVGRQVLQKHQELISLKVVFLPQVGFLISIDKRQHNHDEATNTFPSVPDDFEFVFTQDNDAFFKSDEMNQLDEEIGDLDAYIKDTEAMVVSNLEEEILEVESELRSTFSALSDLDCILSLAGCAADLNFVKPEIAAEGEGAIQIENGRHPLQELIVDFIPNDTQMDSDRRMLVVTGPNFSGKSCYARQVGVLVYMLHLGSFLPCDSARISLFDQILVGFADVESCAVPQSTFQRDLTAIAGIMRKATPKTLALIDEFGKGTAPASGIAVMVSAIQQLCKKKCRAVVTTHFLEMFSLGLLEDGKGAVKAVQMSVFVPESEDDDAVPLFKLEDGVASSSAGLVVARLAGLNKKVVNRADGIIQALRSGRQVKPLPESLNCNSPFQPGVKSAIRLFLAVDGWTGANDEEIELLDELVHVM
mmetsp:Transcript_27036/g.64161  ORF Transcript_27036/g.64161 Transcript_27036/m.64161 type:complete len:938 (+) Transcript_27036:223-3036(+)